MKRVLRLMTCVMLLMVSGCAQKTDAAVVLTGVDVSGLPVIRETDTHGGFHGDGMSCRVYDCAGQSNVLAIVSGWHALPLSENLSLIVYGGERDGVSYEYNLAKTWGLPQIENGHYRFIDRHAESVDSGDDSLLLDRASLNFTLAIYDSDTDRLYICEFDT